jgi:hypothetical protein
MANTIAQIASLEMSPSWLFRRQKELLVVTSCNPFLSALPELFFTVAILTVIKLQELFLTEHLAEPGTFTCPTFEIDLPN